MVFTEQMTQDSVTQIGWGEDAEMQKRSQHKDKDEKTTMPPKGTPRGLAVYGILKKASVPPHLTS